MVDVPRAHHDSRRTEQAYVHWMRRTGVRHRHPMHESVLQEAVHAAARQPRLAKHVIPHSFRQSFARISTRTDPSSLVIWTPAVGRVARSGVRATTELEEGYDIRTIQNLFATRT
jgi:hypothetical protein